MRLPKIFSADSTLALIQSKWASILNPFLSNPCNDTILLPDIALASGAGTYTFTVSAANATVKAVYTNNGQTYTVSGTISAGTTLVCTGTDTPSLSGTLTKSSGTGDASITFSSFTGTTVVNHNLSRTMQGWIITDINGAASIYRSQPLNDLTLTLTSSAAVTVSLEVF